MSRVLVDDELWALVEPHLPRWEPSPKGGQPRKPDRLCLTGILFVLKTGIPWEDFPQEMGCCGMTLWNRLEEWQRAGVWEKLRRVLLTRLQEADLIDWSRAVIDSASIRAVGGGEKTGPNPTDRRKPGSKHHVLTDARGLPLAPALTAANRHDITQLIPLVDAVPPVRGKRGRPRRRPNLLYADRAYDSHEHRMALWARGIAPAIPHRNTEHGSGLGHRRWVVAHAELAASIPTIADPLRTPRRHPRSVPLARLQPNLLATTET